MDVVERLTLEAAQADTMIACEHRHRYELAAEWCAGRRVLDLCCGSGYGSAILAHRARQVTGVENDAATVETATVTVARQAPNVTFELADAVAYLDGQLADRFDVIVCFEGLEHLHDLDRALVRLREHARRGVKMIASLPNDKLSDDRNPFHVTRFGYDEALAAFTGFPSVVMLPQFLAEGALIRPPGRAEIEVAVTPEGRDEPPYANHFVFFAGFDPADVKRSYHGRVQLNTSPLFNRWAEDLKRGTQTLRRENARLARARLANGGSAAAAALARTERDGAELSALEDRCRVADARIAELEQALASTPWALESERPKAEPGEPPVRTFQAVEARPLALAPEDHANSWESRRRRAAEFLIPWIEQTVPLAGKTVLEYGCGSAPVSCAFAERAGRLIGLDIDAAAIDHGRNQLRERGVTNVELELHSVDEAIDAAAAHRGEIDIVLLYAVLEHLTIEERLQVLRMAREVVRPEGAIVVCETPNRLIYFDHHTAQMPFFHLLPEELALDYYPRSPRKDFKDAIDAARRDSRDMGLPTLTRWGRGASFHEFELAFGDQLGRHVIASNYDPLLFGERPVQPDEVVLARYLNRERPDLAPVFSRYWLDLILSPSPVDKRAPFLRPWTADTTTSAGVGWTASENLRLVGREARLWVTLPQPTTKLVVGSVAPDGRRLSLYLRPEGGHRPLISEHHAAAGTPAFTQFELDAPAQRLVLGASAACHVVFVGYED